MYLRRPIGPRLKPAPATLSLTSWSASFIKPDYLLDQKIRALEKAFIVEGGLRAYDPRPSGSPPTGRDGASGTILTLIDLRAWRFC